MRYNTIDCKEKNRMNLGKENEQIEFKESTSELSDALIDITAILNKHNCGTLYFGVKNNGDVCGMQVGDSTIRDISRKVFEKIKPQIFPTINEECLNEKQVIVVSFSGSANPYSCDGEYYKRVGDESRELSPSDLVEYILNENYARWEKQSSDCTIDDINEDLLKSFYEKAVESKRIIAVPYDKISILSKLNLLSSDNIHLNNAGKILFSNKKPILLKLAIFATEEKRTFIDMKQIFGNIFELIDEAEAYVKKNINWSASFDGFERIDIPEIPLEALREIIVNSFAHANYIGTSKNEIDIHPGRIAIYNPGSFPDGLIPEDFINKDISSKVRNEIICDVLYKCKAIESWATGFKKVYRLCEKNHIKLSYEKEYDGFWFFFFRNSNVTINDSINVTINGLTELEQIILKEISNNSKITRDALSSKTGRSSRHIQRALDTLKGKGYIKRIGSNKTGSWEVLK